MSSLSETEVEARAKELLARWRTEVDEALDRFLPPVHEEPTRIHEAMRYSTLAPGKRFRPALLLIVAKALGVPKEDAMPSACGLEMIHAFSLIHDDLPAMDDDDLRRGRPTNHIEFDEATAVLAGDALNSLAFEIIARHTPRRDAIPDLIVTLGDAVGTKGMIGGQMLDLQGEGQEPSLERVRAIHELKTAALIRVACEMAAILGRADDAQRSALRIYGHNVGLAFQIMDDLLDELATPEFMGKRTGGDLEHDKMTWPKVAGIEASRELIAELVKEAVAGVRSLDEGGELELLARFLFARVP